MKKIVFVLMLFFALSTHAQTISYVEQTKAWYYIYDAEGKKTGTLSVNVGELVGYGSEFLVVRNSSWYYLYDYKGRKLNTFSRSTIGEVLAVSGNTFTSRLSAWIYTWNKEGKKLSTRVAK